MPDNVTTQAVQVASQVVPGMSLGEVGGLTGAVVAAAMVFATVWSKFKAGNAENSAGSTLYTNLADQLDKLTKRLDVVEVEKEEWQKRAIDLESKVKHLEKLETENAKLISRLDLKDEMIDEIQRQLGSKENQLSVMLQEASLKNVTIQNLTERVHDLELRLERQLKVDCDSCSFRRTQ